jgi:hypothetical protein
MIVWLLKYIELCKTVRTGYEDCINLWELILETAFILACRCPRGPDASEACVQQLA